MRTVTVCGQQLNVKLIHEPGRFPQRRWTFVSEFSGLHVSESGSTPYHAWRNLETSIRQSIWELERLRQIVTVMVNRHSRAI